MSEYLASCADSFQRVSKSSFQSGSSPNPFTSLKIVGYSSGSSLKSVRATSQGESSSSGSNVQDGRPFKEMVKKTAYGNLVRVHSNYEVSLVHRQLHWLLMVKMMDSDEPYISMEIVTSNMFDIIPVMREIQETELGCFGTLFSAAPTKVGIFNGTLIELCGKADTVVKRMDRYNLLTSNCQHFCNNVLQGLGLRTFPTTVGPETTLDSDQEFDTVTRVLGRITGAVTSHAGVGHIGAAVVGVAASAPRVARSGLSSS